MVIVLTRPQILTERVQRFPHGRRPPMDGRIRHHHHPHRQLQLQLTAEHLEKPMLVLALMPTRVHVSVANVMLLVNMMLVLMVL
mmetsp:Transcript_4379/g.9487  ORF Transcript_4379/g.9487 Transcript_4379/m.9487 type:complete len:84 (-) Transcript_4379:902-1153(-)